MKVAIIGYGWVGQAYAMQFPDAVIYDPYSEEFLDGRPIKETTKDEVNKCDIAIVCVPTNLLNYKLDMSIVEEVVGWLETPLILIKSALQPGTTDRLVKETGKKIAVSVEMVGEGKYFVPFWKYPHAEDPTMHDFLIVGGEKETAIKCAEVLWEKMSPDIKIHITSAVEAEICKMMENTWGAMKVTFGNVMYDICQKLGADYLPTMQAWGSDGRTEKMHMRVLSYKRGWKSKCYDKDVPALAALDDSGFLRALVDANKKHLNG